jgi:hypothetical protein
MNVLAEARLAGTPGWHPGTMTTEHSASSYGAPVFVQDQDREALGPGDGIMGIRLHDADPDDTAAARRAGYPILGT